MLQGYPSTFFCLHFVSLCNISEQRQVATRLSSSQMHTKKDESLRLAVYLRIGLLNRHVLSGKSLEVIDTVGENGCKRTRQNAFFMLPRNKKLFRSYFSTKWGLLGVTQKGFFTVIVLNFYTPGHLHGTITQCCFIIHCLDTVLCDAYCVMLSSPDRPKFEAQRAQLFQPSYAVNVIIAIL